MIKVTVIVPVYNTRDYLEKCLDSLINQTLAEIEIIVVNDGSTDDSQQIIDRYTEKYNQIKSFIKENGGLSDARNFGIDRATGEYIGFVDSDDFVSAEMLENMYKKAIEHRAEIVLCDLEKVDHDGKVFRDLPQSPQLPEKIELEKDFTLFGEMSCFACNKIFHRELFKNHRFRKGIHFEDVELIPQLVLESKIISKINQPFYKYFERQQSISRTHNERGLDMFVAVNSVKEAFESSSQKDFVKEWKRFFILQGYYSFLAYVAYVQDKKIRHQLIERLKSELQENQISKSEILNYKRFNRNYLFSLPLKKQVFYLLSLLSFKLIESGPR